MAKVTAFAPLDMTTLDFVWNSTGNNAVEANFLISVLPGLTRFGSYFGAFTPGFIPSGTITLYFEDNLAQVKRWQIEGIALDATFAISNTILNNDKAVFSAALAGDDTFIGSSGRDIFPGWTGVNIYRGNGGNDIFLGNTTLNQDIALYSGVSKFFSIGTRSDGAIAIEDRTGVEGVDGMGGVAKAVFSDQTINLSWLTTARKATEGQIHDLLDMYVAYFDRAPDALGINYWASRLVDGMTLQEIARSFFVQPETLAAYPPGMTTTAFVTQVYANALGRTPDAAGLTYWVNDLDIGVQTRDAFMLAIIYGARAETGSPADAAYLRNKGTVGEYFAFTKGLGDTAWANQAMDGVTADMATVGTAEALVDGFVHLAETTDPHLMLPVLGITPN